MYRGPTLLRSIEEPTAKRKKIGATSVRQNKHVSVSLSWGASPVRNVFNEKLYVHLWQAFVTASVAHNNVASGSW